VWANWPELSGNFRVIALEAAGEIGGGRAAFVRGYNVSAMPPPISPCSASFGRFGIGRELVIELGLG
jgi:hypothetical protein